MRRWISSVQLKDKQGKRYFLDLISAVQTPIRRHIKIKAGANPYDLQYASYFLKRERSKKWWDTKEEGKQKSSPDASNTNHRTTGSCVHGF